ncbi:hypothetical protein E2C01_031850 [Portunus trituberculatus]|uniref:Uncharacterized protein n=1 Tax=Portunus trituberculatus TaxID=210409 RepID=A0A5B7F166_PORTR|nr:hypothetical protein [Portunus trituberculatus]
MWSRKEERREGGREKGKSNNRQAGRQADEYLKVHLFIIIHGKEQRCSYQEWRPLSHCETPLGVVPRLCVRLEGLGMRGRGGAWMEDSCWFTLVFLAACLPPLFDAHLFISRLCFKMHDESPDSHPDTPRHWNTPVNPGKVHNKPLIMKSLNEEIVCIEKRSTTSPLLHSTKQT